MMIMLKTIIMRTSIISIIRIVIIIISSIIDNNNNNNGNNNIIIIMIMSPRPLGEGGFPRLAGGCTVDFRNLGPRPCSIWGRCSI